MIARFTDLGEPEQCHQPRNAVCRALIQATTDGLMAGNAARRAAEELLVSTVQSLLEHEDVFDESVLGY